MRDQIRTLALFDLDGTLTNRDSFLDFLVFAFGWYRTLLGFLHETLTLTRYALGRTSTETAKEHVFSRFFRGMKAVDFDRRAAIYSTTRMPEILRKGALDRIRWHLDEGHDVFIVSASMRQWIEPWAETESVRVIATEPERVDHVLTGKFQTPNCRGEEKVKRIRGQIPLGDYAGIYVYGDSRHDEPMLKLATEPVYRPFRS